MKFGSVCSGIEAASVAWHPLGWSASWLAEIEPFPSAVLARHFPSVPNLGDMTKIARAVLTGEVDAPDVLVGGTPCQAFSVAGMREGLGDERGQLTIRFVELADAIDFVRVRRGEESSVIVWENVPGVLSDKTNAFGCLLGALAGEDEELQPSGQKWSNAGYVLGPKRAIAWRVLDAQYFGVAQRRRRVFLVASARKDFDPRAVLFECEGVRRDTAPSREAGEEIAGTLGARASSGGGFGTDFECSGGLQSVIGALTAKWPANMGAPEIDGGHVIPVVDPIGALDTQCGFEKSAHQSINAGHILPVVGNRMVAFGEYRQDETASCMKAREYKDATDLAVHVVHGTQDPCAGVNLAHTLGCNQGRENAIAYGIPGNWIGRKPENGGNAVEPMHDVAPCQTATDRHGVAYQMSVRRLTPTECERLQGFPDGWTAVPFRGKPASDGPRYKALGNSMAVPCMAWIGNRIAEMVSK